MSDNMKIEKNVPVPESRARKGNSKYPFPDMEEGDSFFIIGYSREKMQSISSCGRTWFQKNKPDFTIISRKEGDGIRFWCVTKEENQ
jgi:hypothetical protein